MRRDAACVSSLGYDKSSFRWYGSGFERRMRPWIWDACVVSLKRYAAFVLAVRVVYLCWDLYRVCMFSQGHRSLRSISEFVWKESSGKLCDDGEECANFFLDCFFPGGTEGSNIVTPVLGHNALRMTLNALLELGDIAKSICNDSKRYGRFCLTLYAKTVRSGTNAEQKTFTLRGPCLDASSQNREDHSDRSNEDHVGGLERESREEGREYPRVNQSYLRAFRRCTCCSSFKTRTCP